MSAVMEEDRYSPFDLLLVSPSFSTGYNAFALSCWTKSEYEAAVEFSALVDSVGKDRAPEAGRLVLALVQEYLATDEALSRIFRHDPVPALPFIRDLVHDVKIAQAFDEVNCGHTVFSRPNASS